jgi:hypothetical protein
LRPERPGERAITTSSPKDVLLHWNPADSLSQPSF